MSDLITSLVSRSFGLEKSVQPRLASRYEEQPGSTDPNTVDTVVEAPARRSSAEPERRPEPAPQPASPVRTQIEKTVVHERLMEERAAAPPAAVPAKPEAQRAPARERARPLPVVATERQNIREIAASPEAPPRHGREAFAAAETPAGQRRQAPSPADVAAQIVPREERTIAAVARADGAARRENRTDDPVTAAPAGPTVEVTIGRLEIRAVPAGKANRPETRERAAMTIDQYLQSRRQGSRP